MEKKKAQWALLLEAYLFIALLIIFLRRYSNIVPSILVHCLVTVELSICFPAYYLVSTPLVATPGIHCRTYVRVAMAVFYAAQHAIPRSTAQNLCALQHNATTGKIYTQCCVSSTWGTTWLEQLCCNSDQKQQFRCSLFMCNI